MSLVAVLAVVFGLKLTAQDGFDGLAGAAILVGLVVGLLFVRRQLTLADPMIDLRLFQNTAFNAALATNLLGIFIAVGYFLFVAQYLQLVLGLSPLEAGLWSLPSAVGFIVGSNLAPRLLRRVRPAPVIGSGLAMAAIGLAVLTQVGGYNADLAILAGASLVVSLGLAPVFTADRPDRQLGPAGAGGGGLGDLRDRAELGGALGIAILGSIGVAVYRGQLADALPADLPAQAAAAARDTLGGAVGVAARLPAELGAAVVAAAREAFIQGLQLTAASAPRSRSPSPSWPRSCSGTSGRRRGAGRRAAAPAAEPAPHPPRGRLQVIRSGSGCMTCPGESRLEDAHGAWPWRCRRRGCAMALEPGLRAAFRYT